MADSADTRVNLAALKRVDPYAVEIVETGTQVAIYKFNSQSNEWVRLILCHSCSLHSYSIAITHCYRRKAGCKLMSSVVNFE